MINFKNKWKKIFKYGARFVVHDLELALSLRHVLKVVEDEKKELSLDEIFNKIGDKLLEENICSMISVLDDKKNNLIIRYYKFKEEEEEIIKNLKINILNRKFSVNKCSTYKKVLESKKTFFCYDCFNGLMEEILGNKELKKYAAKKKRATSPLILRGEVIGLIDFFSTDIEKNDVRQLEKFSRDLMGIVANTILFNEVKKTEEKYQDLFENAIEGFFILDGRHKKMTEVNKGLSEITGYTKGELLQINYLTLFSKKEKRQVNAVIKSMLEKKFVGKSTLRKYEAEIITKKGESKYVRITVTRSISDSEWFCVMSDITKRKIAEDEVRRLSKLNQSILDNVPVSIVTLNDEGEIISVNNYAEKIFNNPLNFILGKKLAEYNGIAARPELVENYKNLIKKGKPFVCDSFAYFSNKNSDKRYLNIIAVPLLGKNGRVRGAISMGVDNTEAVVYKNQIESLNRSLEEKVKKRTEELAIANEKLNEVLLLKTKFLSDASHELRTPLTIIQGNLDLAIREIEMEGGFVPEVYDIIGYEVERMTRIITDLTMLSNTDYDKENLQFEEIDLVETLERVIKSLEVLALQKSIKITIESDLRSLKIVADETKLEKLFLNIIRNAIKYTDEKGNIIVKMFKEKDWASVFVKDNGIGIPEKDLPYIFERFYRADKARSRAEGGTGLGLSICKWIIEQHKGRIEVESVPEKGTEFKIFLPINHKESASLSKKE